MSSGHNDNNNNINHSNLSSSSSSNWSLLYKIGGICALIIVAFIPIQIIIFVLSPPPSTVIGFFTLFQHNKLLGLLNLDLLLIVDYALMIPIYLAIYVALRRTNESLMLLATVISFIGIVLFFASDTAFNMFYLSEQYTSSTTDVQRSIFLAAGEATLAVFQAGTSFHLSYIFSFIAVLLVSIVMLKSNVFSKTAGYMGIITSVVGLGYYIPNIGLLLSMISVITGGVWDILIAKRLLKMDKAVESK